MKNLWVGGLLGLLVVALLSFPAQAARVVDGLPSPIEVKASTATYRVTCHLFGFYLWQWGYCPENIPTPKGLTPDTPECCSDNCMGPCQVVVDDGVPF